MKSEYHRVQVRVLLGEPSGTRSFDPAPDLSWEGTALSLCIKRLHEEVGPIYWLQAIPPEQ
jgi:hypothetical protein